ncbi:putative reverse transcriptase domain-containing protein [Tanacetum coccineum]|uniref:Reverse transcriptase domain-containing protein n=1 Tax=Tanacetum coccineum TaxID=301880 RepID=A0ABQ5E3G7_9ASTR
MRDNTFSGSDNEDANEHIEKVLKIVDLFHIPNMTQDQVMLRAFPMSLTRAASRWLRNEPTGSFTTWETLKEVILFYMGLDVPTRKILDSKGALPSIKDVDAKKSIQEMADHSQKWHNGTSTRSGICELCKGPHYTKDYPLKEEGKILEEAYYTQFGVPFPQGGLYRAASSGFYQRNNGNPSYQQRRQTMEESLRKFMAKSTKRHEENSNLIKEIRASTDAAIRNQGASIKALEIQIRQMSKEKDPGSFTLPFIINNLCFNKALADLGASVSVMPFSTYTKLGLGELAHTKLIVELADRTVKRPKGIAENVLVGKIFPVDFIVLDMPEDIKTPLILGRPFLSTVHAKIDVFKRKITLRVGNDKVVFKSDKPTSCWKWLSNNPNIRHNILRAT